MPKRSAKKESRREPIVFDNKNRICAIVMCHKPAIGQAGDIHLCGDHKGYILIGEFHEYGISH